jgi:hypothetical protein
MTLRATEASETTGLLSVLAGAPAAPRSAHLSQRNEMAGGHGIDLAWAATCSAVRRSLAVEQHKQRHKEGT